MTGRADTSERVRKVKRKKTLQDVIIIVTPWQKQKKQIIQLFDRMKSSVC